MPQKSIRFLAVAAAMGVAAWGLTVFADPPEDGPKDRSEGRQSQDGPPRRGPPRPPLEVALDLDHDHEISSEELETATASLKKLDKNGDGKLTPEEYRPPRPDQQGRGPGPRDGQGPREGRGPREGDGPRAGAKGGGDCPKGSSAGKQKSAGKDE